MSNPIIELESIKGTYPLVHQVACDVLPIVATSTPCERLFSNAGIILSQFRSRLLGKRLDELVFLRSIDEVLVQSLVKTKLFYLFITKDLFFV